MDEDLLREWLSHETDEKTHRAIEELKRSNPKELQEAFSGRLAFGTGGVRALMGVGPARLNRYTIRQITQGLSASILAHSQGPHSVVIGHDPRHNSVEFAQETARVLAGNGIKAFLLEELRPTPFISFLVRHLKASAGINLTASHNPGAYNGYKVYGADGAQITSPLDKEIITEVEKVDTFSKVKIAPSDSDLIERIGDDYDIDYLKACDRLALSPEENRNSGGTIKVVYSPLHGAGITLVPRLLHRWGFTSVELVESQMTPDGDFTHAKSPNPEEPEALKAGIAKMQRDRRDLFIATDPDADRLGATVNTPLGPRSLNGNELACILLEHILSTLAAKGELPENGAVIKTIVTTELFAKIAASYNIKCLDLLTGFKYIGEKIHAWEKDPNSPHFIFGAEESYGCLFGTASRDKDAVAAAGLVCEVALKAKLAGKTLENLLEELFAKHGTWRQKLHTLPVEGRPVKELLEKLRRSPPHEIGGHKVVAIEDYELGTCTDGEKTTPLSLPKSGVLLYRLENEGKLTLRGSGTEPKIKIYAELKGEESDLNCLIESFCIILTSLSS